MPDAERYSTKILTDAKAASTPAEAFGMAVGGEQQDDAELATGPTDFPVAADDRATRRVPKDGRQG